MLQSDFSDLLRNFCRIGSDVENTFRVRVHTAGVIYASYRNFMEDKKLFRALMRLEAQNKLKLLF